MKIGFLFFLVFCIIAIFASKKKNKFEIGR